MTTRDLLLDAAKDERAIQISAYDKINVNLIKINIFRFVLFFILVTMIYGQDLRIQTWSDTRELLEEWIVHLQKVDGLFDLKFSEVKKLERKYLDPILKIADENIIPENKIKYKNAGEIYQSLVENRYGFDILKLKSLKEKLARYDKNHGDKKINEIMTGTDGKIRKQSFSMFPQTIDVPLLKEIRRQLDVHPRARLLLDEIQKTDKVSKLVSVLNQSIKEVYSTYNNEIDYWIELDNIFQNWESWSYGLLHDFSDELGKIWRNKIVLMFENTGNGAELLAIDENSSFNKVVITVNNLIKDIEKKEETLTQKTSVWNMPISIPKVEILLLFPFMFIVFNSMVWALRIQRRVRAIRITQVEKFLSSFLGANIFHAIGSNNITTDVSITSSLRKQKWSGTFMDNPHIFTDSFFELGCYSCAIYIFYRWIKFLFINPESFYSTWNIVIFLLFIIVMFVVEFFNRKIAKDILLETLNDTFEVDPISEQ